MTNSKLKIACFQTCSYIDIDKNIYLHAEYCKKAKENFCDIIFTPEMSPKLELRADLSNWQRKIDETKYIIDAYCDMAKKNNIAISLGSIPYASQAEENEKKLFARSIFIAANGKIIAQYDKINLFDVTVSKNESYKESNNFKAGKNLSLLDFVKDKQSYKIGFAICYDLRFPEIFRHYGENGAHIIALPAAFTIPTGMAHWETLLRARAIENGVYIIAPAQVGTHEDTRKTFGNSMIINPWGEVVCHSNKIGEDLLFHEIDIEMVKNTQKKLGINHKNKFLNYINFSSKQK